MLLPSGVTWVWGTRKGLKRKKKMKSSFWFSFEIILFLNGTDVSRTVFRHMGNNWTNTIR